MQSTSLLLRLSPKPSTDLQKRTGSQKHNQGLVECPFLGGSHISCPRIPGRKVIFLLDSRPSRKPLSGWKWYPLTRASETYCLRISGRGLSVIHWQSMCFASDGPVLDPWERPLPEILESPCQSILTVLEKNQGSDSWHFPVMTSTLPGPRGSSPKALPDVGSPSTATA